MKKIVIIPDSFKGTISSQEAGRIIEEEAKKRWPDVETVRKMCIRDSSYPDWSAQKKAVLKSLERQIKQSAHGLSRQYKLNGGFHTCLLYTSTLWTNSYFVSTVGGDPLEVIEQYIENQKTSQRQKDKLG